MKRTFSFDDLIGSRLPEALSSLVWEGNDQQTGVDPLGNVWIRNNPEMMYLSVDSDYRKRVYMTLTLSISENVITDFDWFATLATHGRPESLSPQVREEHQVERLIKTFFKPAVDASLNEEATMKKSAVAPWIVRLSCPFCKKTVAETVNPAKFPKDMSGKDRFTISCDAPEFEIEPCEHLAFKGNSTLDFWQVEDRWLDQMTLVAKRVNDKETDPTTVLARACASRKQIGRIAQEALPEYEISFMRRHIAWGECCHNGPTFLMIFLKKIQKQRKVSKGAKG